MPTLTQLKYIVAVDEHRHFGRAAEASFVSQPSLSMQVQKLEDELGVNLFDRSKKPIVPTPKGQEIIIKAKQILAEVRELEFIGQQSGTEPQGEFRLGVIPTLAPYVVPLFLADFSRLYPKVELFISEMKTQEITQALDHDQIDGGILVTPLTQPRMRERALFYEPFYLFVGQEHPLFKKKKVHEHELEGKDLWLLEEGHCFREQMVRLCSLKDKGGAVKNIHFESGNIETLKELVKNGSGYTLVPYLSIYKEKNLKAKSMVKEFYKPVPVREVSFVYQRERLKSDIIEALISVIDSVIPKELPRTAKGLEVVEL